MPSWAVWMVAGEFLGVAGDQESVGPLFDVLLDVLADVESRALWAGGGPIIHYHYEMLAIGCVLD